MKPTDKVKRKEFPKKVKEATLVRQDHKCALCKCELKKDETDFDHILAKYDIHDNSLGNCQALCRSCHKNEKTPKDRKEQSRAERLREKSWNLRAKPTVKIQSSNDLKAAPKTKKRAILPELPRRNLYR